METKAKETITPEVTEKAKRPSRKRMRRTIRRLTCVVIIQAILLVICGALLISNALSGPDQETTRPTYISTIPTTEETVSTTSQTEPDATTLPTSQTEATTAPTEPRQTESETQEQTEPAATDDGTEPATQEQTTPTTQPTQPQVQTQPQTDLEKLLAAGGESYQSLAAKNCRQLVTVSANGIYADIRFFSCENGQWQEKTALRTPGFVGRRGVTNPAYKQEGDGCTPTGLYTVGLGFYIQNQPNTGLDTFQVTQDTYWVDDPNSQYYNRRVEGTENKDWNSAEHMLSYSRQYAYGFVVNYNTNPIVNGKGSAIFFHVSSTSTAGCIATSETMVLGYLAQLDKTQNPHILIIQG